MIYLTFKQTQSELMVRAAATIIFNALLRAEFPRVRLSSLTEHPQYGFTASASPENLGIKLVRITDLQDGKISWDTVPYCQCEQPEKYLLKPNDILFARTGATTGKTHLVKEAPAAVFASYLIRVRPKGDGCSDYLYYFFQSDVYWRQIIEEKEGSAQPNVNGQKLMNIDVPIVDNKIQLAISQFLEIVRARQDGSVKELPELPPPLDEQRRIVARIEELAAKVEEARGLRRQSAKEAEAFFPSVLSKVTSGFQTPSQLLENLCLHITDGEHNTPQRIPFAGIALATAKNVRDGHLDLSFTDFVDRDTAEKCWRRCQPQHEDILMVCVGATTGRVCRLENPPPIVIVRSVALLRPNKNLIESRFLEYALESSVCQQQVWSSVKQAAQPCLYLNRMKQLLIPVPPLPEQRRIVAYLDNLQSKVDALKRLQTETAAELDALLPSILDKAFKGEL